MFFRREPKEVKTHKRYQFIHNHRNTRSVKHMCKALTVSESGYYRYISNLGKPSKDAILSAEITEIVNESKYNRSYGVPRMQLALEQRGIKYGKRKVTRVKKRLGLIHTRRIPNDITKVTTEIEEKENLIKQNVKQKHRTKNCLLI